MEKTKREKALEKDMRFAAMRLSQAWSKVTEMRTVESRVKEQIDLLEVATIIEQALIDLDVAEYMPECAGNYHE